MKISRILFALTLVTILASCKDEESMKGGCLSAGLQNGLIAHFPFSNGSLADVSGGQHDLTNTTTAAPGTDRDNNANCAFQFDNVSGPDEFLSNTSTSFLNNLPSFSVSLWYMHTNANATGSAYQVLLSRGEAGHCPDRRGEWSLGLFDCARPVFGHDNSIWANWVSGDPISCQSEITALSNSWHHLVAVRHTTSSSDYLLYLDDVLQGSVSGPGDCGFSNYTAQDIGDLFLGKYFTGRIDDVLIYDRVLTATEVSELYAMTGCCE